MTPCLYIESPMTPAESARWTTAEERAAAAAFDDRRRTEYLAWRALVRRELGSDVRIFYHASGAPAVDCPRVRIGVAHCPGRIAVCISDRPCAVDIETESRDFSRAAPRFLTVQERALSANRLLPGVVWCAKETLYKLSGREGLDLLRDIRITAVDIADGTVIGRVLDGDPVRLTLLRQAGYIVVYRL